MRRILVVSPHPDDEAIGCGGTLCSHVADGDAVSTIFLTSGEGGGHGIPPTETANIREHEAREAGKILGLQEPEFWRSTDGKLKATRKLIQRLKQWLNTNKPDIVYTTHKGEMHPDHRAAFRIVQESLSGDDEENHKPLVRLYEVWTPLQLLDEIVDISEHIEKKLAAVRAHKSQCDVLRFDDAVLGLNRYRGEMHSWPGGDYAEVFMTMSFDR